MNQVLNDAQAESQAAWGRTLRPHPGAEDTLLVFGRNAGAVIGHADPQVLAYLGHVYFDVVAVDRVAAGVGQQVREYLDDPRGIGQGTGGLE